MSKQALEGQRLNAFGMDPDKLTIIGLDTDDGPEHPLYDERVRLPLDESFVKNVKVYGVIEDVIVCKDADGRVLESFTPDFYLPEFNLYVELTTMKQSLVTKKNRKVKLLRLVYPNVNIQVFYQKDFENLIFKYGLAERAGRQEPAAQ